MCTIMFHVLKLSREMLDHNVEIQRLHFPLFEPGSDDNVYNQVLYSETLS